MPYFVLTPAINAIHQSPYPSIKPKRPVSYSLMTFEYLGGPDSSTSSLKLAARPPSLFSFSYDGCLKPSGIEAGEANPCERAGDAAMIACPSIPGTCLAQAGRLLHPKPNRVHWGP